MRINNLEYEEYPIRAKYPSYEHRWICCGVCKAAIDTIHAYKDNSYTIAGDKYPWICMIPKQHSWVFCSSACKTVFELAPLAYMKPNT